MGSLEEENSAAAGGGQQRKPRFLCLHGFRTSGEIMRAQVMNKWPDQVTSRLDLFFPDAPFPARGKSEVEGIFPPPYYEWYQLKAMGDSIVYMNLEECMDNIEQLMIKHGPFDGLMGFSQGANISAALACLQAKGMALRTVPKIKYFVIISGFKFRDPAAAERIYPSSKIDCISLHVIGDLDSRKVHCENLLELFVDPFVIRHPKGHTVPRLDDKSHQIMLDFLQKIEGDLSKDALPQDAPKVE